MTCPACGFESADGARFCAQCGAALDAAVVPIREERKVVTVLFCDLVGFTARAERLDPEDVRAVQAPYWDRVRGEIERFGGTVEKFIGDAVMALFGAPVAHEDDPERAVRAAFAIREAAEGLNEEDPALDLHVRMAVATGEALVSLSARPSEGEGMASGDVVNTAARLQSAAPVDGILVEGRTQAATERVIVYREAEPVEAKGKTEPIRVWEALEPRARFGVDVAPSGGAPLVGREAELSLLTEMLSRVRRELSPQLLTLVGVPGIGKSRLVAELFEAVEDDPELIFWRQGRSLPYGEGVTYWALGEMVKGQAGILETDTAAETEDKLNTAVSGLLPDPAEAAWVEGHLGPLVGLVQAETREDTRSEAFAAWRRFFEALAERGPTVLVFEDLHWADDGLLDFADHLVDWASGVPLLVLATARPELLARRPAWGGGKPNVTTLSLSPLSDEETARLLHSLLRQILLPAETQRALLARAEGNPLYAEEYVRLLEGRKDSDDLPLPETVHGIIAARLDQLSPEEKELLQDASVVGKVFWLGALTELTESPRSALEELLHGLERREFVRRERRSSVGAESQYAFRHALVREVAYSQIPRAQRADKHRRAAVWIESLSPDRAEDRAEMLAHHYLQALDYATAAGRDAGDFAGPARLALKEAGDRALALNAFIPAARFYERALALWPVDDPGRAVLLFLCGRALLVTRQRPVEILEEARDLFLAAGDASAAAEAEVQLSRLSWWGGDSDRSAAHLDRADELVRGSEASPSKAFVLAVISRFHMLGGRSERAISVGREALAMAQGLGLGELQASALNNIGCARVGTGDVGGLQDLEQSIEISLAINSWEANRGYINLASMAAILGDLRRCRELHEEAGRVAERFGLESEGRFLEGELAIDHYFAGDWDEALRRAEEFIEEVESGSPHYLESQCREVRAAILLARGQQGRAVEDSAKALEAARRAKDPQNLFAALGWRSFLLAESGRSADASALASELLGQIGAGTELTGLAVSIVPLGFALSSLGREHELLGALEDVDLQSLWIEAASAYASGELARAADLFGEGGDLPAEAYARLRAARALMREGRRPEGEAQLAKALAFWRSVGATAHVREGEALLAASA